MVQVRSLDLKIILGGWEKARQKAVGHLPSLTILPLHPEAAVVKAN